MVFDASLGPVVDALFLAAVPDAIAFVVKSFEAVATLRQADAAPSLAIVKQRSCHPALFLYAEAHNR